MIPVTCSASASDASDMSCPVFQATSAHAMGLPLSSERMSQLKVAFGRLSLGAVTDVLC